jgi:hypothetical protein
MCSAHRFCMVLSTDGNNVPLIHELINFYTWVWSVYCAVQTRSFTAVQAKVDFQNADWLKPGLLIDIQSDMEGGGGWVRTKYEICWWWLMSVAVSHIFVINWALYISHTAIQNKKVNCNTANARMTLPHS